MNCPSRTDDAFLHPEWNQSPPLFAADLTTCEDMGHTANARELGDAECLKAAYLTLNQRDMEGCLCRKIRGAFQRANEGDKCPYKGPCTHTINILTSEFESHIKHSTVKSQVATCKSWALWLVSVLLTSASISLVFGSQLTEIKTVAHPLSWTKKIDYAGPLVQRRTIHFTKRSACAIGGVGTDYNLPFHVGALFIILFVSTTGCAFPLLVIKFPRLRIPATFLFSARHFGTGVLIATAFVHLLPTAFISLGNPCLSTFWTEDYPAMPGAIALAAIFFVTLVEMVFSPGRHICSSQRGLDAVSRAENTHGPARSRSEGASRARSPVPTESMHARDLGPLHGRVASISRTLSRMGESSQALDAIEYSGANPHLRETKDSACAPDDSERSLTPASLSREQMHKKAVMQCFLLEMGILFHSVFIGMSLSVSVGSEFVILLIAIIFHQTFEGLALGARIGTIEWPENALQPWLMALAYGCTTPVGQAIGIATHTLYSPDSQIGLLVVGIMNAISAGLLVFASLVELMSEDFLSDESWQILRGKRRAWACFLVFSGAFLMSLVGAWA